MRGFLKGKDNGTIEVEGKTPLIDENSIFVEMSGVHDIVCTYNICAYNVMDIINPYESSLI